MKPGFTKEGHLITYKAS